jgi:hypothetical protein
MDSNKFDPLYRLPRYDSFVGRKIESSVIQKFLEDRSDQARSVMLVHGPRGTGKSALAHEAAQLAISRKLFETVLWVDQSRIKAILELLPTNRLISPPTLQPSRSSLTNVDMIKSLDDLLEGKNDFSLEILQQTRELFRELMHSRPYLLIIDDFDEYCTLRDLPELCEQLSHIQSYNKIIITSRTKDHKFSSSSVCHFYPLGALELDAVESFTRQLCEYNLEYYQLIDGDPIASAEYITTIAGGMPEFIKKFLLPMLEQKGQILNKDYAYITEFCHFSANYLVERYQGNSWERYQEGYNNALSRFKQLSAQLSELEKQILFDLVQLPDNTICTFDQLTELLGYRFKTDIEKSEFQECIQLLHSKRFITRYLLSDSERNLNDSRHKNKPIYQWRLPLPIKVFLQHELFNNLEAEQLLWNKQIDRWIQFFDKFPGQLVQSIDCFKQAINAFHRSYKYKEFQRTVKLGELLCKVSHSKLTSDLIEIREITAQAALHSGIMLLAISQWLWLARHYLTINSEKTNISALAYASKTIQFISDEINAINNSLYVQEWVEANYVMAEINLRNKNLDQVAKCLSDIKSKELHKQERWAVLAYKLALAHVNKGFEPSSIVWTWLNESFTSAINCGANLTAAKVEIEVAHWLLISDELQSSSKYARSARNRIDQISLFNQQIEESVSTNLSEILIKAIIIEAQAAYHLEDPEKSIELLQRALEVAEAEKLHPLVTVIYNSLMFVQIQNNKFNPAVEISKVLGVKLYWGIIENQELCILCRQKLALEDFVKDNFWACPRCNASYHMNCMKDHSTYACPNCLTIIPIEQLDDGGKNGGS